MKRTLFVGIVAIALAGGLRAHAEGAGGKTPAKPSTENAPQVSSPASTAAWLFDVSFLNAFEGNINHDQSNLRSYGAVPGISVRHESSRDAGFVFGYDGALNNFTGTDKWDRISHGAYALGSTHGGRWRLEAGASATWKGSSDERELSNEYSGSGKFSYRLSDNVRLVASGGVHYKQYPDDPGTTGFAPFFSGKIDRRLSGDRKVALSYKRELRQSREQRQRYERNVFGIDFSTPFGVRGGRLTTGFDWKEQSYDRFITVGDAQVKRHDDRLILDLGYEVPVSANVSVAWRGGFETRRSNDLRKEFFAPAFGMNVVYHRR